MQSQEQELAVQTLPNASNNSPLTIAFGNSTTRYCTVIEFSIDFTNRIKLFTPHANNTISVQIELMLHVRYTTGGVYHFYT